MAPDTINCPSVTDSVRHSEKFRFGQQPAGATEQQLLVPVPDPETVVVISCTVQPLLVLGTLVFLRSSFFFSEVLCTGILAHGRIINFFISEDNCNDDDESHSIRVGWWLVGLGLGLGLGSWCGTVGLGLGLGFVISERTAVGLGLGLGLGFGFGLRFGVRYGGFGFGFWLWLWVLGLGLGSGCGTVRWGGVCRGGVGGAADRYLSGKLNAYRSQCKVKGGCHVRAQRVRFCLPAPLGLSLAPVRV